MTGKSDTGDAAEARSAEAPEGAASDKDEAGKGARPRRIVRSRSTAVASGEGEAARSEGEAAPPPAASAADAPAAPEQGAKEDAPRPPRHDLRAPARPAGGPAGRPRPYRSGPPRGGSEGMPQRPPRPGALPSQGARPPRPEGMPQRPPRPGALPDEGRRPFDPDRPRPPRGDRPPFQRGDRQAFGRAEGGEPGARRDGPPRGDRPRFPRPAEGAAPGSEAGSAEAKAAARAEPKPAAKPAAPPAKPAAPPAKAVHKPATPAPLTSAPKGNKPAAVFVPLTRAGQVTAGKPSALTAKEALAAKTKANAAKAGHSKQEDAAPAAPKAPQEHSTEALAAGWDNAKSFVDQAGDGATSLVDGWLAAANATAIVAVADAADVSSAARKAARKALAVLKSRGVAIPERPKASKADERNDSLEATMLPSDSFGTWSIAITSRDSSGRYRIAEVIAREPAGVIQAAGGWLSGSQLKEGRARAQNNIGMSPVVVPLAWARARVASALAMNAKSGQVIPLGYENCRELIEVASEGAAPHPIEDLEAKVTSELAAERVAASATLHEEPEFFGWMPERRALDELVQHVGQRLGPAGTPDQEVVDAALREETEAATDRYFEPDVREQIVARMRDSAISVRARKGDERALDVLAVARAVKEAGLITAPPREIPFLLVFFQKALSALARMGGGKLTVPRSPQPAPAPAPST